MTVTTTCPSCSAPTAPHDRYCEQCGANLRWASTPCVACGSTEIGDDGNCQQCGHAQPSDRDRTQLTVELPPVPETRPGDGTSGRVPGAGAALPGAASAGVALAGGVSDRGHKRKRNEDAMAGGYVLRGDGVAVVAVVCDGVASVERGDEAAQVAVRVTSEALLRTAGETADLGGAVGEAVRAAAAEVAQLALLPDGATGPADAGSPSSTLVTAVVAVDEVMVGWVGDSRAYWLGERSGLLTTDHALGGVLTRWLGADAGEVHAQVGVFRPDGPGAVLVCSDGLWNYLPDADELAGVALPLLDEPLAAAEALTQRALDAGGRDNITVIVVPYPPAPHH